LNGSLEINELQRKILSPAEIGQGWRLPVNAGDRIGDYRNCSDGNADLDRCRPDFGVASKWFGVAVDLGTTLWLPSCSICKTAKCLGGIGAECPGQTWRGHHDRVQFGLSADGAQVLQNLIRVQVGQMIANLLKNCKCPRRPTQQVNIVGNTVMHHLFNGLAVEPLSRVPFETTQGNELNWRASAIGWDLPDDPKVKFLPCLGGFVGSDILAGILAVGMQHSPEPVAMIDLGTNGEVVVGNREQILCASTAAGPAFEGAQISMGMRATTGAVWKVEACGSQIQVEVIGGVPARGICGSGLVDAVAAD
jgi:uncharacterized 2Fe-2S/4Fe-4S cluster protein (DUF4445 family)